MMQRAAQLTAQIGAQSLQPHLHNTALIGTATQIGSLVYRRTKIQKRQSSTQRLRGNFWAGQHPRVEKRPLSLQYAFSSTASTSCSTYTPHWVSDGAQPPLPTEAKSIFAFEATDIDGKPKLLSEYANTKVQLVVNEQNYTELQSYYRKYKDQGFVVLAFPCNQFGKQEPYTESEILQIARRKFKATFPIFSKVECRGPFAHPVFDYMKSKVPGDHADITWNYTKFLCINGVPVKRYQPTTTFIEADVQEALRTAKLRADEAKL